MRVVNVLMFAILTWLVILLCVGTDGYLQTVNEVPWGDCVNGEALVWDSENEGWACQGLGDYEVFDMTTDDLSTFACTEGTDFTTMDDLSDCLLGGEFLTWDSTAMQWKCASDWGSPSPGKP